MFQSKEPVKYRFHRSDDEEGGSALSRKEWAAPPNEKEKSFYTKESEPILTTGVKVT